LKTDHKDKLGVKQQSCDFMQAKEQQHYLPEEYLALEETAEFRSEYCNGQIFPMAGGTPNHNRITVNFGSALSLALAE